MTRTPIATSVLLVVITATLPSVCLAGPGKAGLWEVSTSLNFAIGGFQVSEDQADQMRQFGIDVPGLGKPFVARQCISPAQAAGDGIPRPEAGNSGCALRNVRHDGNLWTADIACGGELRGSGRMSARFDSDRHFTGTWSFTGTSIQLPTEVDMSNPFSGRWLREDCGVPVVRQH